MDRLDILNRESFVDQLLQLIENISERKASISFAIDGAWGCGKSFVLDMFEKQLEQIQSEETLTDKYLVVRYNCWKYDYYEEPLIAIVSTIIDAINKKTKLLHDEQGEKIKGILKAVGATLLSISTNTLNTVTGIDLNEIYNVVKSGIDTGKAEYAEMTKYDVYFDFKQTLHSLQDILNEISNQYTLVFLVDELDRCLPEYSIKVLERLHHLTENTKNVVSIIAIDKTQLQASVCHIFGFSDANEYLKKFVQFTIPLDVGKTSEKVINKYSDYIALFDKSIFPVKDSIEEFLQMIFINIGAREQERLIDRAMMVHKLLYTDTKDYSFMCVEMLIVVLTSQYQDIKIFSKWFQKISRVVEGRTKLIPFSDFFDKKFEEIPNQQIQHIRDRKVYEYSLLPSDSLYGAIAYIWYEMFLKKQDMFISVQDKTLEKMLKSNVEELMKFSDTIRLIK